MVIKLILQGMRSIITMVMNKCAVNVSSVDKIWHMTMKYSMWYFEVWPHGKDFGIISAIHAI